MDVDSERTTSLDVIQIGTRNISLEDRTEGPILIGESVKKPTPVFVAANDHEASSSKSQFFLPKWCPPGLTRTQRRKLQRLRCQERKEKEAEQQRDEYFNKHRPMFPQKQEWRIKIGEQAASTTQAVKPGQSGGLTGCGTEAPEQAVKPGLTGGLTGSDEEMTEQAVQPPVQAVKPCDAEKMPGDVSPTPMACDDGLTSVPTAEDDEQLVDYASSPEHLNMDINVIHMAMDGSLLSEDNLAHLDFGPKDAIFQKPKGGGNHLKALYVKGFLNGKPISRMLVDGGAIVNLMPYSLFKKLGCKDEELIKTNMTVSGVGGGEPMSAKGVISMELTVGSKSLATAFFVAETQGNYSLILGRDWIHANQCVPSTLHQFLIQWVDDDVEIVHSDTSACVALADSSSIGAHDDVRCLSGLDLSEYQFISCTKNGFVPAVIKPMDNRLNHLL
jgi:hypothetical protein